MPEPEVHIEPTESNEIPPRTFWRGHGFVPNGYAARAQEIERVARVGSWEFDPATGLVTGSEGFFRLGGLEDGSLPLDDALARCHPEDAPALRATIAHSVAEGASYALDVRLLDEAGGVRWVHSRGSAVRDAAGRVVRLFGTVADITERKEAELASESSRQQVRRVMEQANCLLWEADVAEAFPTADWPDPLPFDPVRGTGLKWVIHVVNEVRDVPSWLPVARGEGESVTEAWVRSREPEDDAAAHAVSYRALRTGQPRYTQTFRNRMADGTVRWMFEDVRVEEVEETSDGASGLRRWRLTGVVTDVTERKRAEMALEESRQRLRQVTEQANCLLWRAEVREVADLSLCSETKPLFDADRGTTLGWEVEVVNEAEVLRWLPIEREAGEAFFAAWTRARHPGDRRQCNARSWAALASGGDRYTQTFRTRVIDGTFRWLQEDVRIEALTPAAAPCATGEPLQCWLLTGVVTDVTEMKRLQEHVLQVEKLAALGELVAGIAHEINNPLAAISGHAQLLQMNGDRDVRDDAATIEAMASRASRIVRSLLSFARQGGGEAERQQSDVNSLVETCLDLVRVKLTRANVVVVPELLPGGVTVHVNETQIEQVLLNLVNNAVHALRARQESREILLRTALEARSGEGDDLVAAIYVTDNGAGMSAELAARIFDPFFTTKDVGEGTGLGLSLCHGILEAHGGSIELVRSAPGEGSTFKVILPLAAREIGRRPQEGRGAVPEITVSKVMLPPA
jgi:PAS domain S-box-containing protein